MEPMLVITALVLGLVVWCVVNMDTFIAFWDWVLTPILPRIGWGP